MLKMRLQKRGRRRDYHSRIVVMEARQGTHSGKYVDMLGSYDHKQGTIKLDKEKAADWISKGVQPSVTVYNMLVNEGIIKGDKKNALPKRTAPVVETPAEPEPTEEVATEEAPKEESTPAEEEAPTEPEEKPTEETEEAKEEEPEAPAAEEPTPEATEEEKATEE
jgi:small subunit ribosomal protein S16